MHVLKHQNYLLICDHNLDNYKFLDHTTDIIVEIHSQSIEGVFTQAGLALSDTMIDLSTIESKLNKKINVTGYDLPSLLYSWLEELIVIFDIEGIIFNDFKINITQSKNYKLEATALGEIFNKIKHKPKIEVKAVTYHMLKIKKLNNYFNAKFLLDI